MLRTNSLKEKLETFGVGRRSLDDELFRVAGTPARLGLYDVDDEDEGDEEDACHRHTSARSREAERQYEVALRYRCARCGRALPSPHLLDLHVQETHDSFFAAMAARKPSYCCYVQECTDKFINTEERMDHCVKVHKLPKDFRFEMKPKGSNRPRSVELDVTAAGARREPQVFFHNSKQKSLAKYSGKKFTSDKTNESSAATSMDAIMSGLEENLPNCL